jgi:carboxylesterase
MIIPQSEPFFLPGGPSGCLLLHGFTSTPEEMRWLGDDLAHRGYTVLGQRLAGHATDPHDLARTRWQDWLIDVEDGLAILSGTCDRVFVVGLSMGGIITLTAAARYPMAGVVAMSTPYEPILSASSRLLLRVARWVRPMHHKPLPEKHPTLPERREPDYPAYPSHPTRIILELDSLLAEMRRSLPQVRVPALLIHSRQDAFVPAESMERIYAQLGTSDKETLWLENFDHAVVRDPKREMVFAAVAAFIERVTKT